MPNLLHELAICSVIAAQQTFGDSSCQQTMEGHHFWGRKPKHRSNKPQEKHVKKSDTSKPF